MAATVWRRHAGRILLDVAKDTAENVAATISFYSRLGIYAVTGEERFRQLFRADGTRWTYVQLRQHHPRLSRLLVGMTGLLFGVVMLVALVAPRASSVGVDESTDTSILGAWLVTGVFAVVNGAAFAASADIVHIRYALLAHVLVLMLVYRTTLRWALAKRPGATA